MTEATMTRVDRMIRFLEKRRVRIEAMQGVEVYLTSGRAKTIKTRVTEHEDDSQAGDG